MHKSKQRKGEYLKNHLNLVLVDTSRALAWIDGTPEQPLFGKSRTERSREGNGDLQTGHMVSLREESKSHEPNAYSSRFHLAINILLLETLDKERESDAARALEPVFPDL